MDLHTWHVTCTRGLILRAVTTRQAARGWCAPAPVFSRVYQEMSSGMEEYHAAFKMKEVRARLHACMQKLPSGAHVTVSACRETVRLCKNAWQESRLGPCDAGGPILTVPGRRGSLKFNENQ